MDKSNLDSLNRIVNQLSKEDKKNLAQEIRQLTKTLAPKDPKGGRPRQYFWNGRISVMHIDHIQKRLKEQKIPDPKNTAYKILARYYLSSPHAIKRQYLEWKSKHRSIAFEKRYKTNQMSDQTINALLKLVHNIRG